VTIGGIKSTALLDTGATVSTISETFYRQNLSHCPIQPLKEILHIECADGEALPYSGFIKTDIVTHGVGVEDSRVHPCLLLVVPTSRYSSKVPVLLGTNILESLMDITRDKNGPPYLQTAKLMMPWYLAFHCMALREKDLRRNQNRLAWVRSAHDVDIVIKPNCTMIMTGCFEKQLDHRPTCALLQPALKGNLNNNNNNNIPFIIPHWGNS
jgi:hypothetical protein